jgi:hypothetical protein
MNSDGSVPASIQYLRRCDVCGAPFFGRSEAIVCCSKRNCRIMMAEFESFQTLRQMLSINRWTGGKSQKQLQKEYFKERLWDGVRRLPHSDDLLGEVLIEIVEDTSK